MLFDVFVLIAPSLIERAFRELFRAGVIYDFKLALVGIKPSFVESGLPTDNTNAIETYDLMLEFASGWYSA